MSMLRMRIGGKILGKLGAASTKGTVAAKREGRKQNLDQIKPLVVCVKFETFCFHL